MKNASVFFLLIFYFLLNLGFSVNLHYCGGKLSSFSFFNVPKKCASCGKKDVNGCCKDVQIQLGSDESHVKNKIATVVPASVWLTAVLPNFRFTLPDLVSPVSLVFSNQFSHKHLGKSQLPIYMEVCSYLI